MILSDSIRIVSDKKKLLVHLNLLNVFQIRIGETVVSVENLTTAKDMVRRNIVYHPEGFSPG